MNFQKIIFVYNTDNGLFNAVNDWAHKFFSPETYQCSLCRFTYGISGMLFPWKRFIESLDRPTVFLHRNEFRGTYPHLDLALPAIFVEAGGEPRLLLSAQEITAIGSLEKLKQEIQTRLEQQAERRGAADDPSGLPGRARTRLPNRADTGQRGNHVGHEEV